MPKHIEQPAKRHSAPKSLKTLSRPSSSAWSLTFCDPGTTIIRILSAFLRPFTIEAAARRSSMRALVQEPRNTVFTAMSFILVPGVRSMYSSARSAAARSLGSVISAGFGTESSSDTPWPGLVPQVTNGSRVSASIKTSASNTASPSVFKVFQYSSAASQSAPSGACGRPFR